MIYSSKDGLYPRLLIDPKCENTIWEAKRYRWKTYADKKKQYENNPYDEPHKKDDHAMDALRYGIMSQPDLYANSGEVGEDKLREAMHELDEKMTSVYNNEYDDPRGLLSRSDWMPGMPLPNEETHWEVDEHMGGLW